MKHHARPMKSEGDLRRVALLLMVISAAIVIAVGWWLLQAWLGMGHYVQTIP